MWLLLIVFFLLLNTGIVKADSVVRSSSLEMVTSVEDNVERVDYVNKDGEITYAANKYYATVIKTKGDHSQLDEYFDEEGKPAKQALGHYAVLREYDDAGREYRLTYLGLDKKPVMIRSGYAIAVRSFDEEGRVIKERYYDTKETPVLTQSLGYGCYKEYNSKGRNTVITYFDENENPMISGQGFATMRRSYYESGESEGRVKEEYYFDENDEPISLTLGQYGIYKEYDEFGRAVTVTYLDAKGNPTVTKEGYTIRKFTYYNDDTIATELYYDIDGNPTAASEGQYGVVKEEGKTIYLDKEGNELFNLKNFLFNNQFRVIWLGVVIVLVAVFVRREINVTLLIFYLFFIFYMTFMHRTLAGTGHKIELFWSYRQFFSDPDLAWEILNNIWLFIPLGTILYRLFPMKRILWVPVLASVIIEAAQYFTGTGLCELDDILSNGLGSVLGFVLGGILVRGKRYARSCFIYQSGKHLDSQGIVTNEFALGIEDIKNTGRTMDNTWKVICLAIRASVFKEKVTIPSDVNWEDVFTEAKKQAIAGIVRSGIKAYLPAEIALEWKLNSYQDIAYAVQLLDAQKEMERLLNESKIPHCILKGTAVAVYYPEPILRTMGDVDFIVPEIYFEHSRQLFLKHNYEILSDSDTRHIKMVKDGILFELHHHFSSSEKDKPVDVYIKKAFAQLETVRIRSTDFWILPRLENGLVLLTHLRQHLYDGLGIRQVIDWMMYVASGLDDRYWENVFKHSAKELGLEQLAIITTRMCQKYLGLSLDIHWCKEADDKICEQLLKNIIQTGNFGKIYGRGKDVEKTVINLRKEGFFRYLQKAGEFNWKAYHKFHWLKPFAWIYQIFRYIRQGLESKREGVVLRDDMKRSVARYELLKGLDLL